MELVENLICCSTKYFGIKLVEQTSIIIQFLGNRIFWQQQRRSIYSSSRWELFLFQLNFSFSQSALMLSILPKISPMWIISNGVDFLPGTQSKVVLKTGWHLPTSTKLKIGIRKLEPTSTKDSDVTYCLFSKTSFCSGRDWHDDRHRSISAVASFWLTGTILLVDGLPNLARRLLASTGFTETSKIAKMKIILKAEIIFMVIEKVFFKLFAWLSKLWKYCAGLSLLKDETGLSNTRWS